MVVDLSGTADYFSILKENIIRSLSNLPEYACFSLITIGSRIGIYDLGSDIPRVTFLHGNTEYKPWKLYLVENSDIIHWNDVIKLERFALPIKDNLEKIKSAINSLSPLNGNKSLLGECIYSLVDFIKSNIKNVLGTNVFIFLNNLESNTILPSEDDKHQDYDNETEYTIKDDIVYLYLFLID